MASVVVTTHSLLFNSIRWGNLGKSAALILETLSDGPLSRKGLEERLGYSQGGASGILKKLRDRGLVRSDGGVYSLVDDFNKRIQPFLEENNEDIEEMKKVHEGERKDEEIRLEAWRRARQDDVAIQRTAEESQGVYYLLTMNPEAIYNRVRLRMHHHYQQLKSELDNQEHKGSKEDTACA